MYKQGEIYFIDLNPAKGVEERKTRPCVIVSNNNYNKYFNTLVVIPISSSEKYYTEEKYKISPFFIPVKVEGVQGTILLQHIRSIDPNKRIVGSLKGRVNNKTLDKITDYLKQFL